MLCLKRWNLSTQDITILTERYQTSLCHLKPAFTILIFNCSWTQFFKTKYPRAIIELQIPILTTTQHTDLCLTFKREEKSGLTNQLTSYIFPMCFSRPDSVKQQQQLIFPQYHNMITVPNLSTIPNPKLCLALTKPDQPTFTISIFYNPAHPWSPATTKKLQQNPIQNKTQNSKQTNRYKSS